jgi:hypothetical protein
VGKRVGFPVIFEWILVGSGWEMTGGYKFKVIRSSEERKFGSFPEISKGVVGSEVKGLRLEGDTRDEKEDSGFKQEEGRGQFVFSLKIHGAVHWRLPL